MGERLSVLDTMFLDLEQRDDGAHMHIGAALVFDPRGGGGTGRAPDISAVRDHVRARLGALPRYAQRLSGPHAGPLTWLTWEPVAGFDSDAHVHHATLPAPGDDAELRAWLADFWSHRLDRRAPLWEMTLVDGLEGGRWALATKTHHCLVDGVGSWDIGYALLDRVPDAPPRAADPAPPAVEAAGRGGELWLSPGVVARGARAGLGAMRHPGEVLDRARAALDLLVREEIVAAPQSTLNGATSATRLFEAVRFALDDVKAIKRERGGTVNDVVLALCAGGLRHLLRSRGDALPERGLRAQIPVNIRAGEREHALGNQLTSLFVELPVAEPDPLVRYDTIVERAEAFKAGSQGTGGKAIVDVADAAPPLVGELVARPMFGGARVFNLTITNVPGPQERLYALGAPMVEILPLVPLFAGHAIGIAVVSYAGQMVFGLNADRLLAPDVAALAEGIERSFAELRTPARPPAAGRASGR
ncbi:MAG TPA: wax ester/triacylglycerol synthase family O-acyltransferase [Baekduia sp.]|nr:wax ester/triacylglycerol synthase family O-acyltransferase [Baekduia sp.]